MEFWEFLLQKEGDRSWLPLESPNVEILEGRYRVVARSSRPNTILEIKITQQDLDEVPPVRRIQKRSAKTNPQGLVVIMPFTRLQPGDWELRCTGDLMDDMLGKGWSQMVQLQVSSVDLDSSWHDDEPIEVDLARAEAVAPDSAPSSVLEADSPPEVSVPLIELPVAPIAASELPVENSPVLAELAEAPKIANIDESHPIQPIQEQLVPSAEATIEIPAVVESQPLRLILTQDTWVIQRHQPLTITGTIAALKESSDSVPIQGQLHLRLFDPQNSQILFAQHYQVPENQPLPIPFACELSLPVSSTYLVLGELTLYGIAQSELPPVLATQSFNVTTELHELLEAIANNFSNPDLALPSQATVPKEPEPAKIDLSFFNIPPVTQTLLKFQSSEQNLLPPQLYPTHPTNHSAKVRQLDLPSFAVSDAVNGSHPAAEPDETAQSQETIVLDSAVITEIVANLSNSAKADAADLEDRPAATTSTEIPLAQVTAIAPAAKEPVPPDRIDELIGDWDEDWEIAADGTLNWRQLQPKKPASPEDRAFQSLNLQNRFINRLQTLATDPEISDWLREPAAIVRANPIDQEIVVDDDELDQPPSDPAFSRFQAAEPVPVPQVEVPPGELIAGQMINITVKLPKSATRVYAKLWVRDRHLRVLIEGPRWLVDFKPNGFGALKAQTTITLPLGCMEVQFEAIAIEMTSQSESQKAVVCRSVISPELSALSREELEG
ncbi:MAG: hypothetical protein KME11_06670 [Timaviella obliquedivisa GSE-PSE-MK23-08B]|jgi:hypothetical protein|nr:hypothetical protein [Timaviella obliquedivisa GSE-PSE-MK23-08B]